LMCISCIGLFDGYGVLGVRLNCVTDYIDNVII